MVVDTQSKAMAQGEWDGEIGGGKASGVQWLLLHLTRLSGNSISVRPFTVSGLRRQA